MTDGWLMDADCVHGVTWWECAICCEDERPVAPLPAAGPEPEETSP